MSSDKATTLATMNQVLEGGVVPHNTALGLEAVDVGEGWVTIKLPYAEQLVGNPDTGVLHGGAITATLDATSGFAVFMAMKPPTRIATIDLRIDYMGPAAPGRDVLVRAECYKITRYVAFARGVAYHDDPGEPIASAAGSFMIFREEKSPTVDGIEKLEKKAQVES